MDVEILQFPETRVAVVIHLGPPEHEHETVQRMIAWKLAQGLTDPLRHRSYGLHYGDPKHTAADMHRVDFCLSIEGDVAPNPYGIVAGVIPSLRCARARDIGSRADNRAAAFLVREWLPRSGEAWSGEPLIFHYVNVGPKVRDADAVTDVYLPLR